MIRTQFQRLHLRKALALGVALWGVGCTTQAEPDVGEEPVVGAMAVLQVERRADVRGGADADAAEETGASLTAAFARYRGLDGDQVTKFLGTALPGDVGLPSEVGSCAWVDDAWPDDAWPDSTRSDAVIELLDAGRIRVQAADAVADISARTFPELGGLAAGVFYAEDAALGPHGPDTDHYEFQVSGQREVAPFIASVRAPAEPTGVEVAGQVAAALPVLMRGQDVSVRWDVDQGHDLMEIELWVEGELLRCVSRDEGALTIPGSFLDHKVFDSVADSGPFGFSARRVRVQSFDAAGFELAYVRATASVTFDVYIR